MESIYPTKIVSDATVLDYFATHMVTHYFKACAVAVITILGFCVAYLIVLALGVFLTRLTQFGFDRRAEGHITAKFSPAGFLHRLPVRLVRSNNENRLCHTDSRSVARPDSAFSLAAGSRRKRSVENP